MMQDPTAKGSHLAPRDHSKDKHHNGDKHNSKHHDKHKTSTHSSHHHKSTSASSLASKLSEDTRGSKTSLSPQETGVARKLDGGVAAASTQGLVFDMGIDAQDDSTEGTCWRDSQTRNISAISSAYSKLVIRRDMLKF